MDKVRQYLKRHARWVVAGGILLVIIGAGLAVYGSLSSPVNGSVNSPAPATKSTTAPTLAHAQGSYASFSYPSTYSKAAASPPAGTMVEAFALANRGAVPPADIDVSILQLPSGQLADDGSYHYRQVDPSKYRPETWTIAGASVPIMDDTSGGYAKVAFLVHGQLVAEISVSCTSSADSTTLDNDLKIVITNFKWLKNG